MILLMLRDGSMAEIPQGRDIIHRKQSLICLDYDGQVIVDLNASEVLAYTCSEAAARRFVNDAAELESEQQDGRPSNGKSSHGEHSSSGVISPAKGELNAAQYARH